MIAAATAATLTTRIVAAAAAVGVVVGVSSLRPAGALAATFDATDRGWYDHNGLHNAASTNYSAGESSGKLYRNWFVFDLSAYSSPFNGAALHLFNDTFYGASETYSLFDVSTSISSLTAGGTVPSTYADLGSGTLLGTRTVTSASNGTVVQVTLNSAGLSYLNPHLGGMVAFGGALTSADGVGDNQRIFLQGFGNTPLSDTQLVTTLSPDRYYVGPASGAGAVFSNTSNWSVTPGGVGGAGVPSGSDTIRITHADNTNRNILLDADITRPAASPTR